MTPEGQASRAFLADLFRPNDGTAYWLDWDRPGPWDDPEGAADLGSLSRQLQVGGALAARRSTTT